MSKTAVENLDCPTFFREVAAAPKRVLVVDYDGTIAPFCADRDRAFPYPEIPQLLCRILTTCNTRVIMLSGRAAHRIVPLLGMDPAPEMWGCHGLERIHTDGRYQGVNITDDALDGLAEAEILLEEEGLVEHIDISPSSVAVHWRGLPPHSLLSVRTKAYRVLNAIAACSSLVVVDFDGGVEIRVPSGCRGDAMRSILSEIDADVPIAYLGDDTPDEEAFRILNGRGLSVLVNAKHRFTAAQLWLRPPGQLVAFFNSWIQSCGEAS
jgi:trehalose 6-phosphate phosphatase